MSDPVEAALSPGAMVGGYRIERRLGQGGVGTVFAAEEPAIKKRVAIKVLRRVFAEDATMAARFEREARAVNEIRHPGIIDVFAIGKLDDGRPYLVMSLLEGRSLREEIEARGALPLDEAWRVAREMASALSAVHAAGVVHRDLKPDNVFLERAPSGEGPPRVRVLDFGIAKVVDTVEGEPMKLTATGVPLGTPAYMAPEQWWGTGVSARTDQYALGIVIHELITGRPPFTSQSFAELVQQHVHEQAPLMAGAPDAVQALVSRLMSKREVDRFASMSEVIEAGDRAFGEATSEPAIAAAGPVHGTIATAPTEIGGPASTLRAGPAKRALGRFLRVEAAVIGIGSAAMIAIGYAGYARHDPREWMKIGGWGQLVILALAIVGALGLARVARRRATTGQPSLWGFWLALLPALQGAFTTYTGWSTIQRHMPEARVLDRFTIFSAGTYEANAARFFGFAVAMILCLTLAALPGVSGMAGASVTLPRAPGVRPREATVAAIALSVIAAAAAIMGAPSATLVAGVAAATLAIGVTLPTIHAETATRDELERAVAGVLAVALAAAVGITRIEAREAVLWDGELTRAARVAEIVAARGERDTTIPIATLSLLVVAAVEGLRVRRLAALGALRRPRTGTAALGTVLALAITGDLVLHGRFFGRREELGAALGSQFSLFSRLDPPSGDALDPARFVPHRATALQITRDVVAVDGRGVARLAALTTPEGAAQVSTDLNHRLAQAALGALDPSGVDLSVSVDREVTGDTLLVLLGVARRAGVRRVEILLTRGEAPRLRQGPPEIDVVLPGDFVALPAELGDEGVDLAGAGRFGSIAPALIATALAGAGPARIRVR